MSYTIHGYTCQITGIHDFDVDDTIKKLEYKYPKALFIELSKGRTVQFLLSFREHNSKWRIALNVVPINMTRYERCDQQKIRFQPYFITN